MEKSFKISLGGKEAIVVSAICCVLFAKFFQGQADLGAIPKLELPVSQGNSIEMPSVVSPETLAKVPRADHLTLGSRYPIDSQVRLASAHLDPQDTPWGAVDRPDDAIAIDLEEIDPLEDADGSGLRSPRSLDSRTGSKNPPRDPAELPDRELSKIDDLDIESEMEDDARIDSQQIQHQTLEEFLFTVSSTPITTASHTVSWSLDDAINAALLYSYQVDALRIETVENFQQIGVEFGRFDAVSFLEQSFRDSNTPVGNNFEVAGMADRVRGEAYNFRYGLRQELRSGGQLEIAKSFGTRDDDSGVLNPPDQATSELSLRLSKELLRGSGRSIGMSQVLIARHASKAGQYDSITAIQNLLENVSDAYWDIFSARAALVAAIETAQRAENVLSNLEARTNIDADPNLLEQARVSIIQQRAQADSAYANLARTQFQLVQLVNAPELLQNFERIEIIPTGINFDNFQSPDVISRQNTAIHNRTEIKSALENIQRAQVEYQFSINDLLPRLAFSIEGIFEGLSGERDISAATENSFDSNATYELGLNFELPIQNRAARFQKRRAELALARLNQEWRFAVESVKRDVLNAIQDVETNHSLASRQRQIFSSSIERLAFLEERRFNIPQPGSIPSLQLGQFLDVQSQVAQSKSNFANALAERERALFSLNRASGILVAPVAQGLDNPGTNNFLSIYRQSFESNKLYREHTQQLTEELRFVSKKDHTWVGDTFGYPPADQTQCCPTVETQQFNEQIGTPVFESFEGIPGHIENVFPVDVSPAGEGEIFSPDLSRSAQPPINQRSQVSGRSRGYLQRARISNAAGVPAVGSYSQGVNPSRTQFANQSSPRADQNRAFARPNQRLPVRQAAHHAGHGTVPSGTYRTEQIQYQQPPRRTH